MNTNKQILENQIIIMQALLSIVIDTEVQKQLRGRIEFTQAQLRALV